MRIYDMFAKKIDRPITGVIKVGQIADSDKKQELEEYVVTRELTKHFRDFLKTIRGVLIPRRMRWVCGSPASSEVVNLTS